MPRVLRLNRKAASILLLIAILIVAVGCQAIGSPFRKTASTTTAEQRYAPTEENAADAAATDTTDAAIEQPRHMIDKTSIVLLISFAWADDPAARGFEESFLFALRQAGMADRIEIVRAGSPFETATACDSLMPSGGPLLMVFVGDEGSAAAATMLSAEYRAPMLKITGDQRSYTEFSSYVFEFLPAGKTQAELLGRFATIELGLRNIMMLTSRDAKGRALAEGITRAVEDAGETMEATADYDPNDANIRPELATLFSNENRLKRGQPALQTALTPLEREQMFGDATGGDVLFGALETDTTDTVEVPTTEAFFFVVSPERVETFAAQLPRLPMGTALLGNSSWLNEDALARHNALTNGMYIVAPLLPTGSDTAGLLRQYEDSLGNPASAWELLGLDAGRFVSMVFKQEPRTRSEVMRIVPALTPFTGAAVSVDFSAGRENTKARILHYEFGDLHEVEPRIER
ncbi:MAG: hypothetical protein ACOZB3_12185 [Calditrichota bacterium]